MDDSHALSKTTVSIEDEMRFSYLDYAMSVIIGRALPDVRDGLKPVHRRVLYAMHQSGNSSGKPYRKSAKTVGEVIGKFHPHGDQAVYDTIVRLAQNFSLRYPLIDGQGNFGSIDGDRAAAMRYTEIRMHPLAEELLRDIDKETVDFGPNYDGTEDEPLVLPCGFPNLLANGADGIAVGMATRIPPHNLGEVIDAADYLIKNPRCKVSDLLTFIKGPDFPTAGVIHGRSGITEAYHTGRGRIIVRGIIEVEEGKGSSRDRLVITELPYQVNKVQLIEEIAQLVRDQRDPKRTRKIDGIGDIADIRDESDREGIRVVLELRKEAIPKVVITNLFKHTKLQTTFGAIFLAIVSGRPRVLNLKEMIWHYLGHRREVVVRRTQYLLKQAEARAHILEGLKKALDHLDAIIALIRASGTPAEAKEGLIARFEFSELQAQAILDMRLQRLTQLERDKLLDELRELLARIDEYKRLLASTQLVDAIVAQELRDIRARFADARRTRIEDEEVDIQTLDMIAEEDVVISLSQRNYVKRTSLSEYRSQGRGGKGLMLASVREDDFIDRIQIASTHDHSLWFTSNGTVHSLPVHRVPEFGRASQGKPAQNLFPLQQGERIQGFLALRSLEEPDLFVVTFTQSGVVKRTELPAYANIRSTGIIALSLDDGDSLITVGLASETDSLFLATSRGMSIRFPASEVRPMGRPARGVRGIQLRDGDRVVGASVVQADEQILTLTALGYGKRTEVEEYRSQGRGGLGLISLRCTDKTGPVVAALNVRHDDEIVVATKQGKVIRTAAEAISLFGRNAQGVRIIKLEPDDEVVSVTRAGAVHAEGIDDADPSTDVETDASTEIDTDATEPQDDTIDE
ncbi:MAG: DNA gyrase subunit A [Acidobacteria bacterium]|nr:DNA gyrase subunit A [Acidobacteriota bacterium]